MNRIKVAIGNRLLRLAFRLLGADVSRSCFFVFRPEVEPVKGGVWAVELAHSWRGLVRTIGIPREAGHAPADRFAVLQQEGP